MMLYADQSLPPRQANSSLTFAPRQSARLPIARGLFVRELPRFGMSGGVDSLSTLGPRLVRGSLLPRIHIAVTGCAAQRCSYPKAHLLDFTKTA